MEYLHDFSFDKTEKELNEKGVSYSNAILDVDLEIDSLKHPVRYPLIMKRNELEVL